MREYIHDTSPKESQNLRFGGYFHPYGCNKIYAKRKHRNFNDNA